MNSYPNWPDYALPAPPLNDSYVVTLADNLQRTDFEQGLARQRNVFRQGVTAYQVKWPLTPVQFGIFKGILRWTLADGAGWINIPVFDGADYETRAIRFVKQSLAVSREGGEWMVTINFETCDDIAPSEADTAAALLTYGVTESADDIADLLETAVHFNLRRALSP